MILKMRDAGFSYDQSRWIFENLNFEVKAGEILSVLGQNGIGKTTLLKCITGNLPLNRGSVVLDDGDMSGDVMKYTGYVPQMRQPVFSYLAEDMILMGRAKNIGVFSSPQKRDYEQVHLVLKQLELEEIAKMPCSALSGGQLQMVYIARALVSEPKVLILDEPESHLDYKNQQKVLRLIADIVKERNLIGVINTHYPVHALTYSDKVLFLGDKKHCYGYTKEMVNEHNLFDYFEIYSKIISVDIQGKMMKTIVTL